MQRTGFYKRTRKGKIIRLVHEKYLRSDVGCGYMNGRVLNEDNFRNLVEMAPHKHVLVIDTNVAFHQIDLLEFNCPATALVIVLQTVLQELKHLNLSGYRRITNLLKDENRSYIFFPNESCSDTHVLREANETSNDWNDRAIRTATQFFQTTLGGSGEVIMLSNDRGNRVGSKHFICYFISVIVL